MCIRDRQQVANGLGDLGCAEERGDELSGTVGLVATGEEMCIRDSSQTQGRATYTMQFDSYEPAPKSIVDEVMAKNGTN